MLMNCARCAKAFNAQRATAAFCSDYCRLWRWRRQRRLRARVEYYSPRDIVEAARAMYGGIELDPASCKAANEVVRATNFYSIRDNGLALPWYGRIWINPPFPWKPWVPKLLAEWQIGNVEQILALSSTRVTTAKYFNPLIAAAAAILKMNGRIKFWGPSAGDSPDDGHELFYFGPHLAVFQRHFAPFGKIFFTGNLADP
jgi:ParB family chromosome partitioning protein